MDPTPRTTRSNRRRKGQTLVEFALTLPILMLMIFGIIEFGRIFQAWVSLQNSARAAARYASTGAVHYDIFKVTDTGATPLDTRVLNEFVPCDINTDNGTADADIGIPVATDLTPDDDETSIVVNIFPNDHPDHLFATMYDGTDCDPTNEDHQQLRKDLLRLVSIMYEARESVNALSAEGRTVSGQDSHYFKDLTVTDFENLLYEVFYDPLVRVPGESADDMRGWFDVQMCSSRGLLDPVAGSPDHPRTLNQELATSRFVTVRGETDLLGVPEGTALPAYPFPYCMLNEIPPEPLTGETSTSVTNAGIRWLDAGSAGDRVTIFVTFNHPLITPLRTGVENYLTMQSRRSIVNESFRAPKAIGAFQRSLPPGSAGVGTLAPTEIPPKTLTPTDTPTNTRTPTNTPTDTPEPFSCDKLVASWAAPPLEANRMFLLLSNGNFDQTELLRVQISWGDLASLNNNMYLGAMSMYSDVHWIGSPGTMDNSVAGQTSVDTGTLNQGYRIITAQSDAIWEAVFFSGPSNLVDYMSLNSFAASFTFSFPGSASNCVIVLQNSPEGEPTDPPVPTVGPSPTNTPNCVNATNKVTLAFGGFSNFGGVYLILTNNSGRDLSMTGFDFVWPDDSHPAITPPTGGYRLARVKLGGDDVLTSPQVLWQATAPDVAQGNTSLGPPNAPYNNRTVSSAKGTWLANGTLPPGATNIWMDFDSVSGSLYNYGARAWHFDTSRIKIACSGPGSGGNGGGDSSSGDVGVPVPSPTTTNTPKPTKTAGPTSPPGTATNTRTATKTYTAQPPTFTSTPKTPTLTPSRTPIGQPTVPGGSGGE